MYGSGNVVIFVNLEDTFAEVEALLREHPVYLCVSYDTDLMAMDNLTGYVSRWAEFTKEHEDLTIEIRTKSFRNKLHFLPRGCAHARGSGYICPDPLYLKHRRR